MRASSIFVLGISTFAACGGTGTSAPDGAPAFDTCDRVGDVTVQVPFLPDDPSGTGVQASARMIVQDGAGAICSTQTVASSEQVVARAPRGGMVSIVVDETICNPRLGCRAGQEARTWTNVTPGDHVAFASPGPLDARWTTASFPVTAIGDATAYSWWVACPTEEFDPFIDAAGLMSKDATCDPLAPSMAALATATSSSGTWFAASGPTPIALPNTELALGSWAPAAHASLDVPDKPASNAILRISAGPTPDLDIRMDYAFVPHLGPVAVPPSWTVRTELRLAGEAGDRTLVRDHLPGADVTDQILVADLAPTIHAARTTSPSKITWTVDADGTLRPDASAVVTFAQQDDSWSIVALASAGGVAIPDPAALGVAVPIDGSAIEVKVRDFDTRDHRASSTCIDGCPAFFQW